MKTVLLLFLLLFPWCGVSAADDGDCLKIRYTDGGMSMQLGMMIPLNMQQAIEIPQTFSERLQGAKITKIRVAVAGELSEQSNYLFVSEGELKPTEFSYKQPIEHINKGWNEIALTEPYVIGGKEKLFVGFKIRSTGEVLSMDGRLDNNLGNWIRITEHEDDASSGWLHQGGGNMNIEVFVEGANLPKNDVSIESMEARRYAQKTGTAPIYLIVKNNAAKTVNSLDVKISVDDQELEVRTIEDLSIESGGFAMVNVGKIVFPGTGLHDLSMEIVQVNGVQDEYMADNKAVKENINCKADYVNRVVLLEHFSTMKCPNCPYAHLKMEAFLPYKTDFVHVIHHAGFGSDKLSIDESLKYEFFYSDGAQSKVYAPAAMLDRTNLSKYGANDGDNSTLGPAFAINRETFNTLIDKQLSTPAYISINLEKQYDPETRKLTVTVKGGIPTEKALKYIDTKNTRLNVFLTESGIVGVQKGAETPDHFIHDHAMRKVLTDVWGDALTFNNREFASNTYEYVVPADFDADKMTIVAFLSTYNKSQPNSCEVYNTASLALTGSQTSGIKMVEDSADDIYVTTDGGCLQIHGEFNSAEVFTVYGVKLMDITAQNVEANLEGLDHGVYLVRVHTNKEVKSIKVNL